MAMLHVSVYLIMLSRPQTSTPSTDFFDVVDHDHPTRIVFRSIIPSCPLASLCGIQINQMHDHLLSGYPIMHSRDSISHILT